MKPPVLMVAFILKLIKKAQWIINKTKRFNVKINHHIFY